MKSRLLPLFFLTFLVFTHCKKGENNSFDELELKEMMEGWSNSFVNKIDSNYSESINFELENSTEQWNLFVKDKSYTISKGKDSLAALSFKATKASYNRIYHGLMNAMTAMSQASERDPIPLQYEFSEKIGFNDSTLNRFFFVAQRFFNKDANDKVMLEESASRFVHGGHAIPIFYQKDSELGVRSAWYQINEGEQVNEIGDTNPYPQYIIIVQGEGKAKFGNDTIPIAKDRAYFVPVDSDHVIWNPNKEPIKLIWIAWGKGA